MTRPPDHHQPEPRSRRKIVDFGMLYFSKVGAIVVNLLILPQLQLLLGPEEFGLVALFLTIQALLLVLDLGLSLIVGREVAVAGANSARALHTWRSAELALSAAYVLLLLVLPGLALLGLVPVKPGILALAVIAFGFLTLQNIGYCALVARRDFTVGAGILVAGTVLRGVLSLVALTAIAARIEVFIAVQAGCALLHYLATRWRCTVVLGAGVARRATLLPSLMSARNLLWRARSLSLFGIAGAMVLQADKLVVSTFVGPAAMAPYYLATTMCLVPISTLAGPVASYFQPKLLHAITANAHPTVARQMRMMLIALSLVTILPTMVFWLYREPLIGLWLGGAPNASVVAAYTALLLPGVCIGAFGFIPYIALLARSDFRFQARMSVGLTITTLSMAALFAYQGNVAAICLVYAGYHASSTVLSWLRWYKIERSEGRQIALQTGIGAVTVIGVAILATWLVAS